MSKIELSTITSGYNLSKMNENFQKLEDALNDEVLYRVNPEGEDNSLQTDVDANNKRILNLPDPVSASEPVRKQDLDAEANRLQGIADTSIAEIGYLRDEVEGFYSDAATLTNYQGYWQTGVSSSDKGMSWSYQGLIWLCNEDGTTEDPSRSSSKWSLASSQVKVISSVFDIAAFANLQEGDFAELVRYHEWDGIPSANYKGPSGGGRVSVEMARHNGGTAISLTRTRPATWDGVDLTTWLSDSGSDELCIVKGKGKEATIEDFGAISGETHDSTPIIQKCVDLGINFTIPKRIFRVDGTINANKASQEIKNTGVLKRFSAYSSSTDPVLWFKANSIVFDNSTGVLQSQNNSPKGVVLFGVYDPTDEDEYRNVLWSKLKGGEVIAAGETGGLFDRLGVAFLSNQGTTSQNSGIYWNEVNGTKLSQATISVYGNSQANGNKLINVDYYFSGFHCVYLDGGPQSISDWIVTGMTNHFSLNMLSSIKTIKANRNTFNAIGGEGGSGKLYDFDDDSNSNSLVGYDNYPSASISKPGSNTILLNRRVLAETVTANTINTDNAITQKITMTSVVKQSFYAVDAGIDFMLTFTPSSRNGRYLVKMRTVTAGNNSPEISNVKYITGRLTAGGSSISIAETDIFGTYTGVTVTNTGNNLNFSHAQPFSTSQLSVEIEVLSTNICTITQ